MGLLRFLLALAVVLGHAGAPTTFKYLHPAIAVQVFYLVSGFYMALVITEKYSKDNKWYWRFLSNRLLRLLPLYWIILVASIGLCYAGLDKGGGFAMQNYQTYGQHMSVSTISYFVASHILILGQDIGLFLGLNVDQGSLYFTNNFWGTSPMVNSFFFVPQAWSLSVEIAFI